MKAFVVLICTICIICGLAAQTDTATADKTDQQQLASKRLKYIKYLIATDGMQESSDKILAIANDAEKKFYDDTVKDYKSRRNSDENAKANALSLLVEKMNKNDIKTLADINQLGNDIKDLQGKTLQPKIAQSETSALAKVECTKLDNAYMSMKRDYTDAKKKMDQAKKAKYKSMGDNVRAVVDASGKVVDLEKKFDALPATTPEAKQLQKKLLKQLQLGRDLTKDEAAALEKNGK